MKVGDLVKFNCGSAIAGEWGLVDLLIDEDWVVALIVELFREKRTDPDPGYVDVMFGNGECLLVYPSHVEVLSEVM